MVRWTEGQQQAIDARKSNLLVAAAAGSGKTAVLVERIIQLIIKDRVDIDGLLIVTFTNAAAGEMRERIGAALLQEMEKGNENEEHLRRQMNLLNRASISTLHSFCIDVVRKYFHLLEVDPNFRIGDSTETSIMKMEAIEELFEGEYEKSDDTFIGLVERFGATKHDLPLQGLVMGLYEFIQSQPYPLNWLKEKIEDFSMDLFQFEESPWYQAIRDQIEVELMGAKEAFEEGKLGCEKSGGPEGYREAILDDLRIVEELLIGIRTSLSCFYEVLQTVNHKRLGKIPKGVEETLKDEVKAAREKGKDILKGIHESVLSKKPEAYIQDLNDLYPYMVYLFQMINDFHQLYKEKKQEKGIVDFNDLEHFALDALTHEQVAKEYQRKFEYIFVDEYQDSNIVQETILSHIKKEDNLFMVGDVKQSIYRFRLADPSLFIQKYETFERAEGTICRRIDLSKNFRSRVQIIDGVNYIFKHIMTKEFGEIDYDESAYLYKGADDQPIEDPSIELFLLDKGSQFDEEELLEELEALEDPMMEARIAAKRIKELLNTQIFDHKLQEYRQVEYRDIVILLRTTKSWAQGFLETFMAEGIPAYADVNAGYFETIEINIFMNLLKLVDNKRQDIPLLSVMRSPIGGFTTEELIQIRIQSKSPTYFEAVQAYMEQDSDELQKKLRDFMDRLRSWKDASRYLNIDELIWKLLIDTGYYYYVGSMPGGIQRQANLRILFDRARQFQKTSIKGLFHFIKFIDKLQSSSGDMGTAKILSENDNVVRIMSIHKSKGLEFPVVFVAGMGKQFNLMDINAPVLFHKELGVGPKYVDPDLRHYTDTIAKIAMKNRIRLETLSEEMRILYVAYTRPKDKLILIGSITNVKNAVKRWMKPMNPFHLSKAKRYLDWVCPALMRHQDGEALRGLVDTHWRPGKIIEDPSHWKITLLGPQDVRREEREKNILKRDFQELLRNFNMETASEFKEVIHQRLNWIYPYDVATKIPSKLSVSEIKRLSSKKLEYLGHTIPPLTRMPKFMEGKKQFTGAEKGIIVHFVMQHVDLRRIHTLEEIEIQIKEMVEKELLKAEEAASVDREKIVKFFRTSIGQRILQSPRVFREVPFNYMGKAKDVVPELEGLKENLLIQGVIDCYFEEEDGIVLVDYKTDYMGQDNVEEIVTQYRVQIDLYRDALEAILNKKVKEAYLYLFHLDKEVKL
ncbi:ATP-dependent helicase/nuclease subunit A [Anaerosolibacter carboniphilus]|uniref:ATP-dependent helicase/nuclease subunit A n=1 Tax=Anaerosolibacter carboniphilus TaxID=1417629 RepID=A0A841KWC5_9FIRM|nr:helicase-exonuclease AddAB subunit AddA [Anaerosolibacter carboniphilus]MBB6217673.1 ATP-dependent helicase/nuclease subunit A [Anaerosolibacter carboniphilus]